MDINFRSYLLLFTVLFTGLSAGFFLAWQISVLPGTIRTADHVYLSTMQSINRAILNPVFYLVFFGAIILLSLSGIFEFADSRIPFFLILSAAIVYLIGTIGVTGLGNVPLNDQLDLLNLDSLSESALKKFRMAYEIKWNRLHLIRTVSAVVSFILTAIALLIKN